VEVPFANKSDRNYSLTWPDWLVFGIAFALIGASLLRPIHIVANGKSFDCGTSLSSPEHYRQYPRLYGQEAGKACQRALGRADALEFAIMVLAASSSLAIKFARREPPFDELRRPKS
jgi:hypothetical protein